MARRRKGRDVHGILILDKPSGITSNRALQQVKRLYFARKAGHTGSLDPLASGVLPICFGHATKVSSYLLEAAKHYEVTARLGARTDTGDADGLIVEHSATGVDLARLPEVLHEFVGQTTQIPPMYSALKHQGQRLYALARKGQVVERPARDIHIDRIVALETGEDFFRLAVSCSKGTYIRTLVEDIAAQLGTLAHVTALRRTGAGPYESSDLITIDELEAELGDSPESLDGFLKPLDSALQHWPSVNLDEDTAYYLLNGQAVQVADAPLHGQVRLYQEGHTLVGLGEILDDGRVAPRRLFR